MEVETEKGTAQHSSVNFSVLLNDFVLLSFICVFGSRPIFTGYQKKKYKKKTVSSRSNSVFLDLIFRVILNLIQC